MLTPIALSEGRHLIAAYSLARRKSEQWIVFLPESGAGFSHGSRSELNAILGRAMAARFNYLVINKPGHGPRSMDKAAFEQSFRRERRIEDALATMKEIIPKHHKIFLLGYSEGAYLAPQVARREVRVQAVMMIGGGTRGWLREELQNAGAREREALRRQIREIQRRPTADRKWNGFSYATWHSYRQDSTLEALKALKLPTLAILGRRDRTIDFKSALTDLTALSARKPIQTRVLPRCGHSFAGHWTSAYAEIREFLTHLEESVSN